MKQEMKRDGRNRRDFFRKLATAGGGTLVGGSLGRLLAQIGPEWKNQIGLQLYTVGGLLKQDYEGTLAKLAEIGYKVVEPADPYNNMNPRAYKALLEKYGMKMYSSHSGAQDGPDLEKQLEGFAYMGIRYTTVRAPRVERPPVPAGAAGERPQRPQRTVESVKRSAEQMNRYGAVVKKFGMKILYHNHAHEFDVLEDGRTQYDILLAETDPATVIMQLDIGWAYVGGQDVLKMFEKHPGRYELWHIKDAVYKNLDAKLTPSERQRAGKIVPIGLGEVDYKPVFAKAALAGLKHFVIEQDGAGRDSGDPMADCRVSFRSLYKVLS